MSVNFQVIERIYLDITAQVKAVFPELTIMWIVHDEGKRTTALTQLQHKFNIHPAGKMMLPKLEDLEDRQRFAGIACAREKSKFSLFANSHALACFYVDISKIQDEKIARLQAYMDIYQVLDTLNPETILNRSLDLPPKAFIAPSNIEEEHLTTMEHLGRDVFSVLVSYLEGEKQSTYYLAKYRTQQVFNVNQGAMPEQKVFPVVTDTLRLLISEYTQDVDFKKTGLSPFFPAFSMTREILDSFPMQTANSWQMFCRRAQLMAWAGHDIETILGAAVYYTEDAFIRSDAHLACEILGVKPRLMTRCHFYNTFANDEFNERRHFKLCEEYFEMLTMKASIQNNTKLFTERIHRQNESFLLGAIMGWCVPTLISAMKPLQGEYSIEAVRESHNIFKGSIEKMPWKMITKAVRILFDTRRKQGTLSPQEAANILQEHEGFDAMAQAFEF